MTGTGGSDVAAPPRSKRAMDADGRVALDEWDVDAWQVLVADAQSRPLRVAQEDYDRFLQQFPTAAGAWRTLAEHTHRELVSRPKVAGAQPAEIAEGKLAVKAIYEKASKMVPTSVELWRSYTDFARSDLDRTEATAVYEKALESVCLDIGSNVIWTDYITYIRGSDADEQVKRQSLRRLYERVIRMPIHSIDNFWREYEIFENAGTNKDLAKGKIQENNPKYVAARAEVRGRKNRREQLALNALAVPPRGNSREDDQAQRWKKYLSQEKANPHSLEAPDLYMRVTFAFENCLMFLYRHPDIWVEAARFQMEENRLEEASDLLNRAVAALPNCPLIHFEKASLLELRQDMQGAKLVFVRLLERTPSPIAYIQYMKFIRRFEGIDASRKVFTKARKDTENSSHHVYAAAGRMEYQLNREPKVARNVFELGLKNYPDSVDFALEYITFLWNQGEDTYIRVIFDRVLANLPEDQETLKVWNRYLEFENAFGDAASYAATEKRCREAASSHFSQTWVDSLIARYSFMDMTPLSSRELQVAQSTAIETKKPSESQGRNRGRGRRQTDENKGSGPQNEDANLSVEDAIRGICTMFPPMGAPSPDIGLVISLIAATPVSFEAVGTNAASNKRRRPADEAAGGGDIFKARQQQRAKRN